MVCATTRHHYIQQDEAESGELYKSLRHKKSYKKHTCSKDKSGQIISRISTGERAAIVDSKERFGDWEADIVIGKGNKGVPVTLAERCSQRR
jgi:IS30 family transposase